MNRNGIVFRIRPRASAPALTGQVDDRTVYSRIARGELLGEIELKKEWSDYRGQKVPPGRYQMRYAVQPPLKDHAGTTRYRDFALLIGGSSPRHPFVLSLVPPAEAHLVLDLGGVKVGLLLEGEGEMGM